MLVISFNQTTPAGVFFCNYEEKSRPELDKLLVDYKTLFARINNPNNVYNLVKWASGTISLAICSHNPDILKTLFIEDMNLHLGLIEGDSFLYLDEPCDLFTSFVLLNFRINNIHTISNWKTRFPKIQIYVYNVHTIADIYHVIPWGVNGILTEHTEILIQTLNNIKIDITTNLGIPVFSVETKSLTTEPINHVRNRSRNRHKT